ncbi:glycosyltransferase family protein [Patescibacteria group bacterium]|nr:glycosyltransferase family protein [Patescibacteria group bacterium]MBU1722102.1 glycosyltransferase family protein [Patescibacteria group bacterium]MBU1901592.1 glycosyltransferase family protein [Patescibacteria group bacterium]
MGNTDIRKKVVAVIQVRMGSTRLPQKALLKIHKKTAIEWIKYRLSFCKEVDQVVLSTSDTAENDPLEILAGELGLGIYRGKEADLVDRLYQTAKKFNADAIVRVTGDCPLIDPHIVDTLIGVYRTNIGEYDHITNIFPPTYPDGLDIEVMPFSTLDRLNTEVDNSLYREWITTTIMEQPDKFRIKNISYTKNMSYLRMTLDYIEDLELIEQILIRLHQEGKVFFLEDILELLQKEPSLVAINKNRIDQGILDNIRSAEFHELKEQSHLS